MLRRKLVGAMGCITLVFLGGCGGFTEPSDLPTSTNTNEVEVPVGEQVVVGRVMDGDTFALEDGRKVRVLGINSCEKSTEAGPRALHDATVYLGTAQTVTLVQEPGVGTDFYGRELRYVWVDGQDFGMLMVVKDHTAVYEGRNDASPEYVEALREADTNGRNCAA